jgi:hypothetical protein
MDYAGNNYARQPGSNISTGYGERWAGQYLLVLFHAKLHSLQNSRRSLCIHIYIRSISGYEGLSGREQVDKEASHQQKVAPPPTPLQTDQRAIGRVTRALKAG